MFNGRFYLRKIKKERRIQNMTKLQTKFAGAVEAKESYATVKKRMLDSLLFAEVTVNGRKVSFAKAEIQGYAPLEKPVTKKK